MIYGTSTGCVVMDRYIYKPIIQKAKGNYQ